MKLGQMRKLVGSSSSDAPVPAPTPGGKNPRLLGDGEPIRDRIQIAALLEQITHEFEAIDPTSPVLTLVALARAGFSLHYSDLCGHLNGETADDYAKMLVPVAKNSVNPPESE